MPPTAPRKDEKERNTFHSLPPKQFLKKGTGLVRNSTGQSQRASSRTRLEENPMNSQKQSQTKKIESRPYAHSVSRASIRAPQEVVNRRERSIVVKPDDQITADPDSIEASRKLKILA